MTDQGVHLFFDGWNPLLRILVVGTLAYLSLMLLVRISGARTLARMTSFDFAITVALGSIYGRLMTAEDVTLAEAVVAFVVLVALQLVFALLNVRAPRLVSALVPQPALLFYGGQFLRESMRRARITEDELQAAVRASGLGALDQVQAIALETSGSLTVIARAQAGSESALAGLRERG